MLTLKEKLSIIDNSNSMQELNKEVLPKVHKENYYFVSYSHKDYKKVMKDILLLEDEGINIWYDSDMHIGENWEDIAEMYISKFQCKGIIFYLSENSILSKACNKEIEYVLENNKQFFSINIPLSNNNINIDNMSGLEMLLRLKEEGKVIDNGLIKNFEKVFSPNHLYLSYNDSIKRKKEQIEKLVGEDVFEFELDNTNMFQEDQTVKLSFCKDNSLVKLNLKSKYIFNKKNASLSKIGECVFANLIKLKEVTLPKTVDTLESRVFSNCIKLSKINLDNVSELIDDHAFSNCKGLKINNICAKVIGKHAFRNCESIANLTINSRLIEDSAFMSCINLEEVNIDEPKLDFRSIIGEYKISSTLEYFNNYTFANCVNLKRINFNGVVNEILPNSVMFLHNSCFKNCTSLETISLRGKLDISKASGAFSRCESLSKVNLYTFDKRIVPLKMFENCKNLTTVNGLEQYERIDRDAFKNCVSLTSVNLENAKDIEMYAFYGCGLNEVNLPNVTSIDSYAFKNNTNLSKVSIGKECSYLGLYVFENCTNLKDIEILSDKLDIEPSQIEGLYPETLTVKTYSLLEAFKDNLSNLKCLYIDKETPEISEVISDLGLISVLSDKNGFNKFINNTNKILK